MSTAATKATAMWVLQRLREAGYEALFAGGCVRDMLLGLRSSDYDIATSATPQQVRKLFPHVLLVGAKFGVAMVIHNKRKVEVTTFRCDLSYTDGRRPEAVRFSTAKEDAQRRDFTINGMFYDPLAGELIDYIGGRADLDRRIIRTIGNAHERFSEDYLRMIRAVRFAVRLGFTIEPPTAAAIVQLAGRIISISGERVFEELSKMLALTSAATALERLHELHLAQEILPEMFQRPELWPAAVSRVARLAGRKDPVLAMAGLTAELEPATIAAILRRWGASNDLRDSLGWMAAHLDDWQSAGDAMSLADFKRLLGHRDFARLVRLWRLREADEFGSQSYSRSIGRRVKSIAPDRIAPPPLVDGEDLKRLGLTEGRRLGTILRALYDAQLNEEILTRPAAMEAAAKLIQQQG